MKNETCDILVPKELKNAEHLTVRLGLQRNRASYYVQFHHFEQSLMFIVQTMCHIMNLKAINRYI